MLHEIETSRNPVFNEKMRFHRTGFWVSPAINYYFGINDEFSFKVLFTKVRFITIYFLYDSSVPRERNLYGHKYIKFYENKALLRLRLLIAFVESLALIPTILVGNLIYFRLQVLTIMHLWFLYSLTDNQIMKVKILNMTIITLPLGKI